MILKVILCSKDDITMFNSYTLTFKMKKVKSYTINQAEVLGQGAFGIVYKGNDVKQSTIAAKRIDGDEHPRVLSQDLDRLMQLRHQNIMETNSTEKEKLPMKEM